MGGFKRVFIFSIAIISLIGVSGCMNIFSKTPNRAEIAKKLLKEKYNEEFDIFASGEGYGTLTNNTFKVIAAPEGDKSLLFEAKVEKEGAWMTDQYVEALVEGEVKQITSSKISELTDEFFIKVYAAYGGTEINDKKSVSLEKFRSISPDTPLVITLLLDKNKMASIAAETEYQVLQELFTEQIPYNASMEIYYTDGAVLQEAEEYFKKNAETYYGFDKKLEGYKRHGLGINAGQLNVTLEQFKERRQVQ
jgi:hypothetical protein